ncbi:6-bladed beta-propeller [Gemmatimonadota bacterium]
MYRVSCGIRSHYRILFLVLITLTGSPRVLAQQQSEYHDIQTPIQLTHTFLWDPHSTDLEDWQYMGRGIPAMVAGETGELFIADEQNTRIIHITTEGELLQVIGRSGDGPGEFRFTDEIAYDQDNDMLWVLQNRAGLITLFERTSTGFQFKSNHRDYRFFFADLELDGERTFWTKLIYQEQGFRRPEDASLFIKLDLSGEIVQSVGEYWLSWDQEIGDNVIRANEGILVTLDQGRVAYIWWYRPRIDIWDRDGELLNHREFTTGDVVKHDVHWVHPEYGDVYSPYFFDAMFSSSSGVLYVVFGVRDESRQEIFGLNPTTLSIEEWYQFQLPADIDLGLMRFVVGEEDGLTTFWAMEMYTSCLTALRQSGR